MNRFRILFCGNYKLCSQVGGLIDKEEKNSPPFPGARIPSCFPRFPNHKIKDVHKLGFASYKNSFLGDPVLQ